MTRQVPPSPPDAALARAAAQGDRDALAMIFDRYAAKLLGFCTSVLGNREEAADALQDTFVVAAQRLGQLRDPERLRPWLYAVARHEALARVNRRKREEPMDVLPESASPGSEPDIPAQRAELAALLADASAGLNERDRAVLDLHVRQDLDGQDLADALGVPLANAHTMVSRLRSQVERSLGALLVARRGSRDCPSLEQLLQGWDGTFTPLMRKRVARHVESCDVCDHRRRALVSPLALLAAAPVLPVPFLLREHVLAAAGQALPAPGAAGGLAGAGAGAGHWSTGGPAGQRAADPAGAGQWSADGWPPPFQGTRAASARLTHGRLAAVAGAAAAVVLIGGAALWANASSSPGTTQTASPATVLAPPGTPQSFATSGLLPPALPGAGSSPAGPGPSTLPPGATGPAGTTPGATTPGGQATLPGGTTTTPTTTPTSSTETTPTPTPGPWTVTIKSDVAVSVSYAGQPTNCQAGCTLQVPDGSSLAATADAAGAWSGCDSATAYACSATVTSDRALSFLVARIG